MESTQANNYDKVAGVYDLLAHIYSGGQIRASKEAQASEIAPGDQVLYAGAGSGYDAALAAGRGARVTVVELSPAMAARARRQFAQLGVEDRIEFIQGDVLELERPERYDVVAANFFLNVFSEALMRDMMRHLARQLKPRGKFLIADFTPPAGPGRWGQTLYYNVACRAFGLLADNAIHPIYDYAAAMQDQELEVEWKQDHPLFGLGPRWYRTWVGRKKGG